MTGTTFSKDFPVTSGAFQSTFPPSATGISSSFVSKISASGDSLEYSTYLGGSGYQGGFGDSANAIAVDSTGSAYVTGTTASTDFPVTSGAFQAIFNQSMYKVIDGYVAKLKPDGSALEYGTFLGGPAFNDVNLGPAAIAVNSTGNAYIVGNTHADDFPTTSGAFQTQPPGTAGSVFINGTGYVSELDPTGSTLVYSTYLGGGEGDGPSSIALDKAGDAFITGATTSQDFPVTSGAFQPTIEVATLDEDDRPRANSSFVSSLNPSGSALIYSTYLGGSEYTTTLSAIQVDANGNAWVTGYSVDPTFPVTGNALQSAPPAAQYPHCPVVASINPTGTALRYSTFLCGSGGADVGGIALDSSGNVYVAGQAGANFPVTSNAFQKVSTTVNAILFKLDTSSIGTAPSFQVAAASTGLTISTPGSSATSDIQVSSVDGFVGTVNLTCTVKYQGTGTATLPPTCSLSPAQQVIASQERPLRSI